MTYIVDETGETVGEFRNSFVSNFFYDKAEEAGLPYLKNFIDLGMSVDLKELIGELRSVEWPVVDGMNEVARLVVEGLMKCNGGIALLVA